MDVDGRRLTLSNLDKVLYPSVGTVKGEVIDYYTRIAPVLLPHIRGRAMTFTRWPDGVEGKSFFEKNAPSHTPEWVRKVRLPAPGSGMNRDTIDYVVVDDLPTLVWAANLAALELHVPQWTVEADGTPNDPDLLVFDLDPGPPATIVECAEVATLLRTELDKVGLSAWPKSSGSKGMQLYVPVAPTPAEQASTFAKELAQRLEVARPELVVSRMTRSLRAAKVFVDWSQNNGAKTTIAPYSLRARPEPTASTPLTWAEVDACRSAEVLRFTATEVLERVDDQGDLLAGLLSPDRPVLPSLGQD